MTATTGRRPSAPTGALVVLLVVAVVAFALVFYLWPVGALLWRGRSWSSITDVLGDASTEGAYDRAAGSVALLAGADDPWLGAVHELCHAVDIHEGLSEQEPELFPGDEVPEEHYRSATEQRVEDFARVCDGGPKDTQRWRLWQELPSRRWISMPSSSPPPR